MILRSAATVPQIDTAASFTFEETSHAQAP
jgi:hypothetical protein